MGLRAANCVTSRAARCANVAPDGDDETELPEHGKKPLDFGDPLAGVVLEEEATEESESPALAQEAFGDDDLDLVEGEADAAADTVLLLDVGGLVPSLPSLATELLDHAAHEAPASAFLHDGWSTLGDDVGPDDTGDVSGLGSFIPHGVTESFSELGDGSEEGPVDAKEHWPGGLAALELDDGEPEQASVQWGVQRVSVHDVQALLLTESLLIAAGARLVHVPRSAANGELVLATPPHPLVGVVPWLDDELLCASAVGSLYRYSVERGFQAEGELHRRLALPLDAPIGWTLHTYRAGPGRNGIAVLCSNGRLLLSDAEGRLRSQLGRAAVLGTGLPLTLLHPHDGSLGLRRLEDPVGRWRELPLALPPGLRIDAATALCCHGELVAIAHEDSGVWLSQDHGQHFRRVPGTVSVSAIHFGLFDGRPTLFVASTSAAPAIRVLVCDPASFELASVAELTPDGMPGVTVGHGSTPAEERDEWIARALVWDSRGRSLWLGGSFGLVRLSPA
ncbi:MAG: hypothetical protein ABW217_02700 [Polyangiaceae bacterium]